MKVVLALIALFHISGCTQKSVGTCHISPLQDVSINAELTPEQKEFFAKNYLPCKQRNKKKDPDALFNVGVAVLYGLGTEKAPCKAFLWFKGAADKNHRGAQRVLAQMFSQGVGTFRDVLIAKKYEDASRTGIAQD